MCENSGFPVAHTLNKFSHFTKINFLIEIAEEPHVSHPNFQLLTL